MEGKKRQAKEGGGERRRENKGGEERAGTRGKRDKTGGCGGRPRLSKWEPGTGGRLLEISSSRELGPPTHSPQEQPRPQPGQGRAGQGMGGPGQLGRGPCTWSASTGQFRLTSGGPGGQQWRAWREQGQRGVPRASQPATSSSAGPTFCHQRGRGRTRRGAPADWASS